MRTGEALRKLEEFLDQAYLTNRAEVRVIHGIGSGALKKAVHDYLWIFALIVHRFAKRNRIVEEQGLRSRGAWAIKAVQGQNHPIMESYASL